MIYLCLTFFNENDMLWLNIESTKNLVDHYIIVEGNHTFRGKPKNQNFVPPKNLPADRYAYEFTDLKYLVSPNTSPWTIEAAQREVMKELIYDRAKNDDWVILVDVDEIIDPRSVEQWLGATKVKQANISMRVFNYYFNLQVKDFWRHPKIVSADIFLSKGIDAIRRSLINETIENGGWHFSNVMTPEDFILKHQSFSHSERDRNDLLSLDRVSKAIRDHEDLFNLGKEHFCPKIVGLNTLPESINRFPQFILEGVPNA